MEKLDIYEEFKSLLSNLNQAEKKLFAESFYDLKNQASALINNPQLYKFYKRANCEKYNSIAEVLANYNDNGILVYFTELERYGIFEVEDYSSLCDIINNKIRDKIIIQQLILTNQKQKIIFISSNYSEFADIIRTVNVDKISIDGNVTFVETEDILIVDKHINIFVKIKNIKNYHNDLIIANKKIKEYKDFIKSIDIPCVYFIIEEPFQNRVKIGKANNFQKRLKQLQTGCPNKLVVRDKIFTRDAMKLENEIHKELADNRINGEWFSVKKSDIKNIIEKFSSNDDSLVKY